MHRDIKPDNILIDKGHVVLIDFEIAKLMTTRKDVQRSGSVGYAAPEQYYGLSDQQSDIYSMGILLKELCAHTAWRNNEADIFLTIIRKSTAKRQEERYLTISQMQNDFIITCRSCSSTAKYAESIPMQKEQKV
ncbi:protein kinase domain-containing protein [[Clostridium] innocuum]|uniref:protein kinase domain-containing protein n=1 Tax=Clostridium innocuum TaxID=1522 RepID=UPI003DA4B6CE